MFISIPKDLFVPVLFSKELTLNLDSNNMEYDTEIEGLEREEYMTRDKYCSLSIDESLGLRNVEGEEKNTDQTQQSAEKLKSVKLSNLDKETDAAILEEDDEEFSRSQTV